MGRSKTRLRATVADLADSGCRASFVTATSPTGVR